MINLQTNFRLTPIYIDLTPSRLEFLIKLSFIAL